MEQANVLHGESGSALPQSGGRLEQETLEVLRGIQSLLQKIDGKLENHNSRLDDIEQRDYAAQKESVSTSSVAPAYTRKNKQQDSNVTKETAKENVDPPGTSDSASPRTPMMFTVRPYKHGIPAWPLGDPPNPENSSNNIILQSAIGSAWAIPHDGRFQIDFTEEGGVRSRKAQQHPERLPALLQSIRDIVDSGGTFDVQDAVLAVGPRKPCWEIIERYRLFDPRFGSDESNFGGLRCSYFYSPSIRDSVARRTIEQIIKPFFARDSLEGPHNGRAHLNRPYGFRCEPEEDRQFDIAPWRRRIVFGSTPQASKFLPGEVARRHIRSSIQPRPLANYDHARGLTFRIPFFEIIAGTTANENQERRYEEKTADVENKQWVPGVLFGDKDHRHIRYGVCTISAAVDAFHVSVFDGQGPLLNSKPIDRPLWTYYRVANRLGDGAQQLLWRILSAPLWSILCIGPPDFFDPYDVRSMSVDTVLLSMLQEIWDVTRRVSRSWLGIGNYLNQMLNEEANFLEGDEFVKLMFEDDSYARSRKYFWILGSLKDFENAVQATCTQWGAFRKEYIDPFMETQKREMSEVLALVEKIEVEVDFMKRFKWSLNEVRQQATLLRDGLFNASSVVESRASTRLGENVKLLTYVSIFYLPLAFCASLWAVPNILEHGTKIAFLVTSIVVGAVTYGIVFNLDNLADKSYRLYEPVRRSILAQMETGPQKRNGAKKPKQNDEVSNDPAQKDGWWAKRAKEFHVFGPEKQRTTPSEWLIIVYGTWLLVLKGFFHPFAWLMSSIRGRFTKDSQIDDPNGKRPSRQIGDDVEMSGGTEPPVSTAFPIARDLSVGSGTRSSPLPDQTLIKIAPL